MISVKDYGAKGDGLSDDREAFQRALDQCPDLDFVYAPPGRYLLGRMPGATFACLRIPPGKTLVGSAVGSSTALVQAPNCGTAVRLIHAEGPHISMRDLILSGGTWAGSHDDRQRHGLFATGAANLSLERIRVCGFGGDGIYIHNRTDDASLRLVTCERNGRNGVTFGGNTFGGELDRCSLWNNGAQQVDSEPSGGQTVNGVRLHKCTIGEIGQVSQDYALTVSGCSAAATSGGWVVSDCEINGPVLARWADAARFLDNEIYNSTMKPALSIDRHSIDVAVTGNRMLNTQNQADGGSVVYVSGTSAGNAPDHIQIQNNRLISTGRGDVYGIRASGAKWVCIEDNDIIGPDIQGAGNGAGIYLRATMVDEPFVRAIVARNEIRHWSGHGLRVGGNGAARLERLDIHDNSFSDGDNSSMTSAMSLHDGGIYNTARDVRESGNVTSGTGPLIGRSPGGQQGYAELGRRWLQVGP